MIHSFLQGYRPALIALALSGMLIAAAPSPASIFLRMQTDLGAIDIELFDTVAPLTVANFMNYVNDGDYDGTFFHRSVTDFVLQGGGYFVSDPDGSILTGAALHIPEDPPVPNEFNLSNTRGTIAMAKIDGDPDSATSEWFFNVADNSAVLDTQNGGFTVFAQVLNNGMEVVDAIGGLLRCADAAPFSFLCGSFPEVPFAGEVPGSFADDILINISSIGVDTDGDGVIDKIESMSPNGGDANNDLIQDDSQQHVAALLPQSGEYLLIETSPSTPLQAINVLGKTFAIANPDPSGLIDDRDFEHGYFGYSITSVGAGDQVVTLTLPAGSSPDQFFNFGPAADNTSPHWYEFDYDGETGAEINDNVITLHYTDGKRGDSDMMVDGVITAAIGGTAVITGDGDGIDDAIEDGAPNNGDGNRDGIKDKFQPHVASLKDTVSRDYVTVESAAGTTLKEVAGTDGSSLILQAGTENQLEGLNFIYGFLAFEVTKLVPGDATKVKLYLDSPRPPVKYFKYGPTPDNPNNHFYEFSYDGETGARIDGNVITLHFVDGKRGDSDLTADGVITDPGTAAIKASNTSQSNGGGSGGGCAISRSDNRMESAGAWLLISALMILLYIHGRRRRNI